MKHTIYTNQLDEKCRLYNMHIDNLLNLTRNRMNMLDNMKCAVSILIRKELTFNRLGSSRDTSKRCGLHVKVRYNFL